MDDYRWEVDDRLGLEGAAEDSKPESISIEEVAGSSERRTIVRRLNIGRLMVSLVFSLPPTAGAQPRPLVAGAPIRLPLIEGKDIRFTHLSTEQGLSQSRVDHMLQDRRGFIWIGTYNGLNRYDGYRFKTYKPDPNNPNSLGGAARPAAIRGPIRDLVDRRRYGAGPIRPRDREVHPLSHRPQQSQ